MGRLETLLLLFLCIPREKGSATPKPAIPRDHEER